MPQYERKHASQQGRTGSSSLGPGGGGLVGGRLPAARGGIDYRALREAVTIAQVLELVEWRTVAQSGAQQRGPCPIHKSSSPQSRSFSVNLESNVFQCFGCGEKGNQLDLWMAVSGLGVFDAAIDLARRLHVEASRSPER